MKRFIFIFAMLIAFIRFEASSQFDIAWYKMLPNNIGTVNFSHDSKLIMAWVAPNILIYDVETGELVNDKIPSTANYPFFSKDDSHIFGRYANTIVYYNLNTGTNESYFEPVDSAIIATAMSKDGKYLLATTREKFFVWDIQTGKIIKSKQLYHEYKTDSITYSAQCEQIEISCDNSKIFIKEYSMYKKFIGWGPKDPIYEIKYSNKINIYNFSTLDSIGCLYNEPSAHYLGYFRISDDCKMIAFRYSSIDYAVIIYDINTMQEISKLKLNGIAPTNIQFSSDNKYLVTASSTSADILILWDVLTGERLKERGPGSYETLDISNDVKYIATSTGKTLGILKFPKSDAVIDNSIDFNVTLYPNPTNGLLSIDVKLPISSILKIDLSNLNGTLISNIYNKFIETGLNTIQLNLSSYPAGTYLLKLTALNYDKNYKIVIVK